MNKQLKTIKELENRNTLAPHWYKQALKDVLGLNKEVFHNHNKHPATDEFSKGFEHACKVIEKELKKRITG